MTISVPITLEHLQVARESTFHVTELAINMYMRELFTCMWHDINSPVTKVKFVRRSGSTDSFYTMRYDDFVKIIHGEKIPTTMILEEVRL